MNVVRQSIRLASSVLSIFLLMLVIQYLSISQKNTPLGTDAQFELKISQMASDKNDLVNDLNLISEKNNSVLIKVISNIDDYEESIDIIWFGNREPLPVDIVIDNQIIDWLDWRMDGHLIEAKDMGTRPLYGVYSVKDSAQMRSDLEDWTISNGFQITWLARPSFVKLLSIYFVQNGIGNAVIASLMLLLTTIISWFIIYSKTRAYRLLGGVGIKRLHLEDTIEILKLCSSGSIVALVLVIGFIVVKKGVKQVILILFPSLLSICCLNILLAAMVWAISNIASPKSEYIGKRTIPLKQFAYLGTGIRILTVILALLVLPTTLTSAYILQRLSKEHALWENMQKNVRLSFGDIDVLETDENLPKVEMFFDEMENSHNLQMSLVIDKSILLSEEKMDGYDHIIITDKAWINSFDIGINEAGEGGSLSLIDFNEIAEPLKNFLEKQLPLWTKNGEVLPDGVGFYEYKGEKFLALPPNVGWGSETIQAENPLVILVDNSAKTLKTKGFLLYAASSGNVVFADEEVLKRGLEKYKMDSSVVSIDSIADVALEQAQKFRKEAFYYVVACILILTTMILLGVLSAQLWCNENVKKIFILYTFGYGSNAIVDSEIKKSISNIVFTIIIGSGVSYIVKRSNAILLFGVDVCIFVLYIIGTLVSYHVGVKKIFRMVSNRNY